MESVCGIVLSGSPDPMQDYKSYVQRLLFEPPWLTQTHAELFRPAVL